MGLRNLVYDGREEMAVRMDIDRNARRLAGQLDLYQEPDVAHLRALWHDNIQRCAHQRAAGCVAKVDMFAADIKYPSGDGTYRPELDWRRDVRTH